MSVDPGPRLDLELVKDDIVKLKDAASGAEKACKAFEQADLTQFFGTLSAAGSVVSFVAAGVQIGLMVAGVPSPEERILTEIQRMSEQMKQLQKRTEGHMDALAKAVGADIGVQIWRQPLVRSIGQITTTNNELQIIRDELHAGNLETAGLLARPWIESSSARRDLHDHMVELQSCAGPYLRLVAEASSYKYLEVAQEGANLLRHAAMAWHDANLIGALRIAHGRDADDTSPEPLPPPTRPLAAISAQNKGYYQPVFQSLAEDVESALHELVDDAPQHMRLVADQIIRTGGPSVREHPLPTETWASMVVSQLAERWPWLDVAVIANAQFIQVFLSDVAPSDRQDWDIWQVLKQGSQGQGVVLIAATPRLVECTPPAAELARQRALKKLGPVAGSTNEPSKPSPGAVQRLLKSESLKPGDYASVARTFRAWASKQSPPPGGRMVLVAHFGPYKGRFTGKKAGLGGYALRPEIVGSATTNPVRLEVWCEPQGFDLYGGLLPVWVLGGFSLT